MANVGFRIYYVDGMPIEGARCWVYFTDGTAGFGDTDATGWVELIIGLQQPTFWRIEAAGYTTQEGSPVAIMPEVNTVYLAEGTLVVHSNPEGKIGQISYLGETFAFTTPIQVVLPYGTEVFISMPPDQFVEWEDGSTNPDRTIVIDVGTKSITANYIVDGLPLLRIGSLDQNLDVVHAAQGVKITFKGIEDYFDVPFARRVSPGTYTLLAVETSERTFDFWMKPDGSTTTDKYIIVNVEEDTFVEVHWKAFFYEIAIPLVVLGASAFIWIQTLLNTDLHAAIQIK